jgi:hypothetical protein
VSGETASDNKRGQKNAPPHAIRQQEPLPLPQRHAHPRVALVPHVDVEPPALDPHGLLPPFLLLCRTLLAGQFLSSKHVFV